MPPARSLFFYTVLGALMAVLGYAMSVLPQR